MTGIEGIGEAVTGGLAARAVEPAAAGQGDSHTHEAACLNCQAPLEGEYCHRCGQRAHLHRTLGAFGHDLLHGVLHLEGKTWRTLPMLVWRPGELTRRYVEGERARFVSPLAMFLFSVFLMFAAFNSLGPLLWPAQDKVQQEVERDARELRDEVAQLERNRAAAAAAGRPTAAIDAQIKAGRDQASLADTIQRDGVVKGGATRVLDDLPKDSFMRKAIEKFASNPTLSLYKLQTNAYKFSWALIPISLPFLWLLFLNRQRYRRSLNAYDHVVFVTYSITFFSLLSIVLAVFGALGLSGDATITIFAVVAPVHMFRQLRGAYRLRWASALWRTVALLLIAILCSIIFLMLLIAMGVLG